MLNETEKIYVLGVLCKHYATSNSVLDKRTTNTIINKLMWTDCPQQLSINTRHLTKGETHGVL